MDELKRAGTYGKLSPLVCKQLDLALGAMKKRNVGGRERVEGLKKVMDANA